MEKVRATEKDSDIAFISLGELEVSENAVLLAPEAGMWSGIKLMTFNLANTPSRADLYKKALRDKLASTAKKRYGAHRVVNVQYWPEPSNGEFPEGLIYARGEMIRYQPFPKEPITS
ncbi:MAG: hypothetical protein Q8R76_11275 [Candidatus Omnitrophota bacterium]|nr:hypothetical protein [Candidatus Omnitrophota bacterium]